MSAIDIDDLRRYLDAHVEGIRKLVGITKFPGGQSNPTFLLETTGGRYVLRKQPPGKLLPSAHAVDREYRVIRALADMDVPVPEVYHLCEDPEVLGGKFYIMSFEDGRGFWKASLPDLTNAERAGIYDEMNRVLAALHDVDVEAVGLADFGKPGNYFARQVHRWTGQYRDSETEEIPAMNRLIDWLPANIPPDDGQVSLIHGDYRLDNIIFRKDSTRALAVLDWELSTLGHPFADLAYQCMQLRLPADAMTPGLGGLDRASLGIPTEEEYVASYCRARGIDGIDDWPFYVVFSFFRLAAILQGVLKRAIDGNASSELALKYGAMAPVLAGMATDILDEG